MVIVIKVRYYHELINSPASILILLHLNACNTSFSLHYSTLFGPRRNDYASLHISVSTHSSSYYGHYYHVMLALTTLDASVILVTLAASAAACQVRV